VTNTSITALISAFGRAFHARYEEPKIFDDFLAEKLFTKEEWEAIGQNLAAALPLVDPEAAATRPDRQAALARVLRAQTTPITLSRARYTEELLEAAARQGTRQYVVLGAGFDTFAIRRPDLLETLHVYELDHPATQVEKRRRISQAGWSVPEQLSFVPIDFAGESLAGALGRSTFDPLSPAFFSWLGVTYYLERETVFETFGSLAALAHPASVIVFDYLDMDALDPIRAAPRMQRMKWMVERNGEPIRSGLEPLALASALSAVGLSLLETLSPGQVQARYFEGRSDGYRAFEHVHFAAAAPARSATPGRQPAS
jgi:methyltransferase (TIGR00027 family)